MIGDDQKKIAIEVLSSVLKAIDAYRDQVQIDPNDLGTEISSDVGYQPDLSDLLKRWRADPVGQGLREGIAKLGELIAPHVKFDELRDIAEDAAALSENSDWSIAIINHKFDGLKTSDGRTWRA